AVPGGIEPINPTSTLDSGTGVVRVTGQARNITAEVRRSVVVVAIFYDAAGKVTRVGAGQTAPVDLPPGGTGTFEIIIPAAGASLQRFDLVFGAQ
ncbi:MAG TPA: FxLYD domain-containing protein, partial [Dehalococcoidia bacterium]|nr:FxLYD domain-containing protein [Dehalococcoidia bacterium]